jgi:gluconate kinase
MVFLHASREVLETRLRARHGHFFPAALLDSQLADLESPQPSEQVLVVMLDTATTPVQAVDEIIRRLELSPSQEKMSP